MPEPPQAAMICPSCRVAMNRHADKLVDPRTPEEAQRSDAALGGMVSQVHACPGCGHGAARPAT